MTDPNSLVAKGGGSSPASGMAFQAQLASFFGAAMLAGQKIDRIPDLSPFLPVSIRLETESPVDDILIETTVGGFIFIQAKATISFSTEPDSSLGQVVDQFVRQWLASKLGTRKRGWDRALEPHTDRLLLAVGKKSSNRIVDDLALALRAHRARHPATLTTKQGKIYSAFRGLVSSVVERLTGDSAADARIDEIVSLVDVLAFNFSGADTQAVAAYAQRILVSDAPPRSALAALTEIFLDLMRRRGGVDERALRSRLAASLNLKEPPNYRDDVARLAEYSHRAREHLENFEETLVGESIIRIDRSCAGAVYDAAKQASVLIVGEPGAGKSAVLSTVASRLNAESSEVIVLSVDRLPIDSPEGLQGVLGLSHSLLAVLDNWPGKEAAYLLIDALDAARGGKTESVFKWLISEVLGLPNKRWRVVASIRSFDLRMGQQLATLFAGTPPIREHTDPAFRSVVHVNVPSWQPSELAELLAQAPQLADAIHAGGTRLLDLARIPFNTRLVANLLGAGLTSEAFKKISTQSQLLDLFWKHRVQTHGQAAEACLRLIIDEMIAARALQTSKFNVASQQPQALDDLLRENILVLVSGERHVVFRHHILFDYVTSRVYLDLTDLTALRPVLSASRSLGLMLGPALIFALDSLWLDCGFDRHAFWRVVLTCAATDVDPVLRSVSARIAAELPTTEADAAPLLTFLQSSETADQAVNAIRHIVGSLTAAAEDGQRIGVVPWSYLAAELRGAVGRVAWPLQALLYLLIDRAHEPQQRTHLGVASRSLLSHCLAHDRPPAAAAIGFVADTYRTDRDKSYALLASLFTSERFSAHGDDDIPWLTRKLGPLLESDPAFVVEIYEKTFACIIDDRSEKRMGSSQILPLTTNRRQDFEMAFWSLKEFYPTFINRQPELAVRAYVRAIAAYINRVHPIGSGRERYVVDVNGTQQIILQEDWSSVWASDPDDRHADNALQIVQQFSKWLGGAPPEDALRAAAVVLAENEMGLVWARLLMIGSQRPDVLGSVLWPLGKSSEFLFSLDTSKDAIDFVSAVFERKPQAEQAAFEAEALRFEFTKGDAPEEFRAHILRKLFTTIGSEKLSTLEARSFVATDAKSEEYNARPVRLRTTRGNPDSHWWLRNRNVDVDSPVNAAVLASAEEFKTGLLPDNIKTTIPTLTYGFKKLAEFVHGVESAVGMHIEVYSYANGIAAEALATILSSFEDALPQSVPLLVSYIPLLIRLAKQSTPETDESTEKRYEETPSWSSPAARVSSADAIMTLARASSELLPHLRGIIEELLADSHPAVRSAIACHINALWQTDRAYMWKLASDVAGRESNSAVVAHFAHAILARLASSDPERVEALTMILLSRTSIDDKQVRREVGSLTGLLWIGSGRQSCLALIDGWLEQLHINAEELDRATSMLREAIVFGYADGSDPKDVDIRRRAFVLANKCSAAARSRLQVHLTEDARNNEEEAEAGAAMRLLSHVLDQLYFSSGAFKSTSSGEEDHGNALASTAAKRAFLEEAWRIFDDVTAVGHPQTVHHLLDMVAFLMEADPERAFELTAKALLGAGKENGLQWEGLAASQVVALVGRFLADHRGLFDRPDRRQDLVKCLDIFIEAGWPAARRLLYRLPDLLQ